MKSISRMKWLSTACLLSRCVAIHAEGGCPPGQYPVSGQGWQSCNDTTGYGQDQGQPQAAPRIRWIDHWGAIATDAYSGSLGVSTDMPSSSRAESTALADFQSKHGATCKVQITYRNQCAAMVVGQGGKIFNVNPGTTVAQARSGWPKDMQHRSQRLPCRRTREHGGALVALAYHD